MWTIVWIAIGIVLVLGTVVIKELRRYGRQLQPPARQGGSPAPPPTTSQLTTPATTPPPPPPPPPVNPPNPVQNRRSGGIGLVFRLLLLGIIPVLVAICLWSWMAPETFPVSIGRPRVVLSGWTEVGIDGRTGRYTTNLWLTPGQTVEWAVLDTALTVWNSATGGMFQRTSALPELGWSDQGYARLHLRVGYPLHLHEVWMPWNGSFRLPPGDRVTVPQPVTIVLTLPDDTELADSQRFPIVIRMRVH